MTINCILYYINQSYNVVFCLSITHIKTNTNDCLGIGSYTSKGEGSIKCECGCDNEYDLDIANLKIAWELHEIEYQNEVEDVNAYYDEYQTIIGYDESNESSVSSQEKDEQQAQQENGKYAKR